MQQWAGDLEQLLALTKESCQRLLSEHVPSPDVISSNQDTGLRDVLKTILKRCGGLSKGGSQIHIQVPQTHVKLPQRDSCAELINNVCRSTVCMEKVLQRLN